MRLTGKLRSWNDDRGFGFIAPTHGGAELFVHISALPQDGTRPTVGEVLSYQLGRGKDGQTQAVNVLREAVGPISDRRRAAVPASKGQRSILAKVLGLAFVVVVGAYGYDQFQKQPLRRAAAQQPLSARREDTASGSLQSPAFKCDGRTHCSQMTSCAEAKFFLKHCPGTQMDGNNDGNPCEQQWCTSPFAD